MTTGWMTDETLFIVSEFGEHFTNEVADAAIVRASGPEEAAARGAELLYEAVQGREPHTCHSEPDYVFVQQWGDRVACAVEFGASAKRAPLQCCGGGTGREPAALEGHWAGCPNAPQREEPTPEAPPGAWLTWCWEGRKRVCDDCSGEVLPSDGGYYTCSGCGRVGSEDES